MDRYITAMQDRYLLPSLDLIEQVFSEWDGPEEGRKVRQLVEEIRSKRYYLPPLELLMMNSPEEIIGYAMFSRFSIEERYEDELLILTPVAVRTDMQRKGISRELIEYGFVKAREMGYQAVMVEGNPRNYNPRGFETSADHGIVAGPGIHLPHISCLMVKELVPGALGHIHGTVDYAMYEALQGE
ncbi:MAG: N-acetyltransferase [Clostridia bacterium]|nr:N-acetyltransferase [Clostridia bacterium]